MNKVEFWCQMHSGTVLIAWCEYALSVAFVFAFTFNLLLLFTHLVRLRRQHFLVRFKKRSQFRLKCETYLIFTIVPIFLNCSFPEVVMFSSKLLSQGVLCHHTKIMAVLTSWL